MAKLSIGDPVPDFTLQTERDETVHLVEAVTRGPVVLIFYPMDDTPVCKSQLCAARDDHERYEAAGVSVYGVNNGNAESHRRFAEKYGLNVPLLVDVDLGVARQYGAFLGIGRFGVIDRTVVGVGRDGKVAFYRHGVPSTDEILAGIAGEASVRE
jgi:peroxiredoxin Q/BCP